MSQEHNRQISSLSSRPEDYLKQTGNEFESFLKKSILDLKNAFNPFEVETLHLRVDLGIIYPFFQEFIKLRELSLIGGSIVTIENLSRCADLEFLDLTNNIIKKISNLQHNKKLKVLILDKNNISYISPQDLAGMTNLKKLSLVETSISNFMTTIQSLRSLLALEDLAFNLTDENPPTDTDETFSLEYQRSLTPICQQTNYRSFFIYHLPNLKVFDGIPITSEERSQAQYLFRQTFEEFPYGRTGRRNILRNLSNRENGSNSYSPSYSSRSTFQKDVCSSLMCEPKLKVLAKFAPRQFEYNSKVPDTLVYGSTLGELNVINTRTNRVVCQTTTGCQNTILGLSWLHKDPSKFIAGSDDGTIRVFDTNLMKSHRNPKLYESHDDFHLTSVNINCTDEYYLASGYSHDIFVYDLQAGKKLQVLKDLHDDHINVLKFSHHQPSVFATSSFDKSIKLWDLRDNSMKPIFTQKSMTGNVMVCFSPDDKYVMSSAIDNEVRQYTLDGRLHLLYDIPKVKDNNNFTRSYYTNNGDYIIVGSCEESIVRMYSSSTGLFFYDIDLYTLLPDPSIPIYCQSLRGDPFSLFQFSVLVAYKYPLSTEIVSVNMLNND